MNRSLSRLQKSVMVLCGLLLRILLYSQFLGIALWPSADSPEEPALTLLETTHGTLSLSGMESGDWAEIKAVPDYWYCDCGAVK